MHTKRDWIRAAVISATALEAAASGFRVATHDGFASGRGEAFVATADNPSAIYYNPAGITQLEGANFRAGVYGLYINPTYVSPSGQKFENENDLHGIPHFYFTYTPENFPLSFGLGTYAPFGLSSKWPDDSGFRTLGTEGMLNYYTVNPVVAWKVTESFSIAAGLQFNYSKVDLRQGLFWPTQPLDEFRFKGDGWDIGYNIGAMWKVHEKVVLGATFRSATTVDYDGQTRVHNDAPFPPQNPMIPPFSYRSDAEGELPFPYSVAGGISFRPTPQWNFEFNADYNGWERLNSLTINQQTAPIPLIPQNVPVALDWESSWYYEFGATRYIGENWSVSAGYILNENSVPSSTYHPLVADQDRHFFTVGTGYKGTNLNFDFSYQLGYGPSRTVTGSNPSAIGQTADGDYKFLSHGIIVSGGWHF